MLFRYDMNWDEVILFPRLTPSEKRESGDILSLVSKHHEQFLFVQDKERVHTFLDATVQNKLLNWRALTVPKSWQGHYQNADVTQAHTSQSNEVGICALPGQVVTVPFSYMSKWVQ